MLANLVEKRAYTAAPPWLTGQTIPGPLQDTALFIPPSRISDVAALRVPTVWACVSMIADYLAAAPTEVYRKDAAGLRSPVSLPSVIADPAAGVMSPHDWWFALVAGVLLTGNGFAVKDDLDRQGYPQSLPLLDPTKVRPVILQGRISHYETPMGDVPAELMLHIRAFMLPGRPKGISPIEQFGITIGMGLQAEQFGYRFFSESAIPSGIVYSDDELDAPGALDLKNRIMDAWRGHRGPAVLGSGLKYERVQSNPAEAQFIESQHFTIEEICRVFHMPPEMVGHGSSGQNITYANLEERQLGFQQFTLLPWAARIETALSTVVPRPQYVKLDLDHLIRMDEKTRYANYGRGLRDGWLCPDDVLAREDMKPLPDGKGQIHLWPLVAKPAEEPDQPPPAADQGVPLTKSLGGTHEDA